MSTLIEVTLISAGLSFMLVILSKLLTNQAEMKKIKQETSEYRKKIKEAQKQKNEAAVKEYSSKMLKLSHSQFKYTTKSTLASMVIVIFAFSWLGGRYGGVEVSLNETTTPDNHQALSGFLSPEKQQVVFYDTSNIAVDANKDSIFDDNEKHKITDTIPYNGGYIRFKDQPKDNKITAEWILAKSPVSIPFIGNQLTWFWLYVFITIPTTLIFRKLLDVQ